MGGTFTKNVGERMEVRRRGLRTIKLSPHGSARNQSPEKKAKFGEMFL